MASPSEGTKDEEGKRLLGQAWEYGQKIDRTTRSCKHTLDLFGTELQTLRKKLRDKCLQVILCGSTYATKAEDLLWKKSIYDVVQKCKANSEAIDRVSPLCTSYRNHLDMCIDYYCRLLEKLEEKAGVGPHQPSDAKFKVKKLDWLKDVYYQCFVHMGDLARYQITVGGNHFTAVAYYHHAIAMDPSKGASYNQLAALAGSKNEHLDAVYYYQRSVTSANPFAGSLSNLTRIYEKNLTRLPSMEKELETTTEQDIREFARDLLLVRFIRLQQMLQPDGWSISSNTNEKEIEKMCGHILTCLEECLANDLSVLKEVATEKVTAALSSQEQPKPLESLPHDLLLKICALAILSAYTLRSLGSTFTPPASSFTLSIFSKLLEYAYKRLSLLLTCALKLCAPANDATAFIDPCFEEGESMMNVLQKSKFDVSRLSVPSLSVGESSKKAQSSTRVGRKQQVQEKKQDKRKPVKRKLRKLVNRRRRRGNESDTSEEEDASIGSNSSDSEDSLMSESTFASLPDNLGEDDLEMLDRLSDHTSSSEDESKDGSLLSSPDKAPQNLTPPQTTASPSTSPKKGKRQIVLAANFNLPPSKSEPKKELQSQEPLKASESSTVANAHVYEMPAFHDTSSVDDSLRLLMSKTGHQSVVHAACCLIAEESYLMPLRAFMQWLQSYPIAVATSSKGSSVIWSHLAALLNFLPSEDDLSSLDDPADVDKQFENLALLEDIALRGFSPLLQNQESLMYGSSSEPTKTKQAALRIQYFQRFGHFIADLRTVPSFSMDRLADKFIGPAQKQRMDERRTKEKELEQEKQAQLNRSKLMNAMAQQKLQHDIASLEVSAKKQETLFTPYLMPDAASLCSGLHLVKKLLATEKFIVVIAKSTIEALDGMKKGKENFAAREVIKFLERELKDGNKFIKAQKTEETVSPNARKPVKMELDIWYLDRLIDCAIYYNQSYSEKGQSKAVVTVLLHQKLLKLVESPSDDSEQVTQVVQTAWQHGIELDSSINFYSKWQKGGTAKRK